MKTLERIILSILRKPLKTILLILVAFVAGNVISGSFIIFSSTQKVNDQIKEQVRPIVMIHTQVEDPFNDGAIDEAKVSKSKKYKDVYNYVDALNEISLFEEVVYADFNLNVEDLIRTKDKTNLFEYASCYFDYDKSLFGYDNIYNETKSVGVNHANSYYFRNNDLKIVEGRNFTEEEIREGKPVVLLPKSSGRIKINELYNTVSTDYFKLNEKIELVYRIYNHQLELNAFIGRRFDDNGEFHKHTKEEVNALQKEYEDALLYEEVVELEVVGFYSESNFMKQGNHDINFNVYMPLNFYINQMKKHNSKVEEYRQQGLIDPLDREGFEEEYNFIYGTSKYNYFELSDNSKIESFKEKASEVLDKYGMIYEFQVNNDLYMKVAGPLHSVNDLSKLILIVAIVAVFIILTCLSLVFMKDRKNEMGILLSLGEKKKKVMMQMMAEILLVGMIGIVGSLFTSKQLGVKIANDMIQGEKVVELSEQEKDLVGIDNKEMMNEYENILESSNVIASASISILVLVISSGSIFLLLGR